MRNGAQNTSIRCHRRRDSNGGTERRGGTDVRIRSRASTFGTESRGCLGTSNRIKGPDTYETRPKSLSAVPHWTATRVNRTSLSESRPVPRKSPRRGGVHRRRVPRVVPNMVPPIRKVPSEGEGIGAARRLRIGRPLPGSIAGWVRRLAEARFADASSHPGVNGGSRARWRSGDVEGRYEIPSRTRSGGLIDRDRIRGSFPGGSPTEAATACFPSFG